MEELTHDKMIWGLEQHAILHQHIAEEHKRQMSNYTEMVHKGYVEAIRDVIHWIQCGYIPRAEVTPRDEYYRKMFGFTRPPSSAEKGEEK